MLNVVVWKWNQPGFRVGYTPEIVQAMRDMVAKYYQHPHRFICITDDPTGLTCETFPLWDDCGGVPNMCGKHLPSCYRRLKLFSNKQTEAMGIPLGSRVVSMDLDMVVTNDLSPLFNRPERFVGWQVTGARHAKCFNGSMWLFQTGIFDWLWNEFDINKSPRRANDAGYFGSDQSWISYRLAGGEAGWTGQHGMYSFTQDVMRARRLPFDARVVSFNGKRKPWEAATRIMAPWIGKFYPYAAPAPPPKPEIPPPVRRKMTIGIRVKPGMTSGTSLRHR